MTLDGIANDEALIQLSGLTKLKSLTLTASASVTAKGLAHLLKLSPEMTVLYIDRTSPAAVNAISNADSLTSLMVSPVAIVEGTDAIAGHPTLSELTISQNAPTPENGVSAKFVASLEQILKGCRSLRVVSAALNDPGDAAALQERNSEFRKLRPDVTFKPSGAVNETYEPEKQSDP